MEAKVATHSEATGGCSLHPRTLPCAWSVRISCYGNLVRDLAQETLGRLRAIFHLVDILNEILYYCCVAHSPSERTTTNQATRREDPKRPTECQSDQKSLINFGTCRKSKGVQHDPCHRDSLTDFLQKSRIQTAFRQTPSNRFMA